MMGSECVRRQALCAVLAFLVATCTVGFCCGVHAIQKTLHGKDALHITAFLFPPKHAYRGNTIRRAPADTSSYTRRLSPTSSGATWTSMRQAPTADLERSTELFLNPKNVHSLLNFASASSHSYAHIPSFDEEYQSSSISRRTISPVATDHFSGKRTHEGTLQGSADRGGGEEANRDERLRTRVERLVQSAPVVLFMKGTPKDPRCGYSRAIVEILQLAASEEPSLSGCDTTDPSPSSSLPEGFFRAVDVWEDLELREALKRYTNWPTVPQLFIEHQFVGGTDIAAEMFRDRSLHQALSRAGKMFADGARDAL
ncbi:glutaredoxin domain-containing protein [Toxoplasma gondii ARI]|uniref:Glutaredoxin domain-containing protein n=1 Tax=Toxoplasma gondii ARI TaxID=1074872 RepID=A0A139YAX8_TOXGO|nr:glutaredoxin domain-containing protein [Toxoplasma gondii ARI]